MEILNNEELTKKIGALSESVNDKSDRDLNNTQPLARTVVEVSSKDILPSWYRIYSDGWCEQGGHYTHNNVESTITTTLLKNFTSTNYNLQITKQLGTNSAATTDYQFTSSYVNDSKTISSFQVRMPGANRLNGYDWQTSGYIN